MSKTVAVHVRYESLYISLPSSAKQQREMTKFCGVYETRTMANVSYFRLELNAYIAVIMFLEQLAYRSGLENREFRL